MNAKLSVLVALIICSVLSLAIIALLVSQGLDQLPRPDHNGRGAGQELRFLAAIVATPIIVFIVGAAMKRKTIRAATSSDGGAALVTLAFATFPIWFWLIALAILNATGRH
jgi:hypothetical protein